MPNFDCKKYQPLLYSAVVMQMSVLYSYGTKRFGISHGFTAEPDPTKFTLHTHPYVEIYCFVQGAAIFHIEGTAYPLECGDLLLMRSTESHYVEVDPSQPYERINVRFDLDLLDFMDPDGLLQAPFLARPAGKQNHYPGHLFRGGNCRHYFDTMMSAFPDRQVCFFAGLIPLLQELCQLQQSQTQEADIPVDSLPYQIMRYLTENLQQDITLSDICEKFYVSRSQLCRIFRNSTGVTVKRYLAVKRLVRAKQLIDSGQQATHVYLQCGFNDYSSFYRAYVKYFGTAPTQR